MECSDRHGNNTRGRAESDSSRLPQCCDTGVKHHSYWIFKKGGFKKGRQSRRNVANGSMKHWCMELFSTCTSFRLWINRVKAENWEMIHLKDQMWLKHWAVIQTEGQQRRGWVEARVLWPWNQIDPGADHNIHFQEQIHVFNTSLLLLHWLWEKSKRTRSLNPVGVHESWALISVMKGSRTAPKMCHTRRTLEFLVFRR